MVNITSASSGFAVPSIAGSWLGSSGQLLVRVLPAQSSSGTPPRAVLLQKKKKKRVSKSGYFKQCLWEAGQQLFSPLVPLRNQKCCSFILPGDFISVFRRCQSSTSVPQVQIIFTQRRNAISEPELFSFLAKAWSFVLHIYLQNSGRENEVK